VFDAAQDLADANHVARRIGLEHGEKTINDVTYRADASKARLARPAAAAGA
jgi:hypothetical protein